MPLRQVGPGSPDGTGCRSVSLRAQQYLFQVLPAWWGRSGRSYDGEQPPIKAGIEAAFGSLQAFAHTDLTRGLLGQDGQQHLVPGRPQRVGGHPGAADGDACQFYIGFGGIGVQSLRSVCGLLLRVGRRLRAGDHMKRAGGGRSVLAGQAVEQRSQATVWFLPGRGRWWSALLFPHREVPLLSAVM